MNSQLILKTVTWQQAKSALSAIREQVFIIEQDVPKELEWDDEDQRCQHVLALYNQADPVGTGRILANGHIGRMAVIKHYRNLGIGSAILQKLLEIARTQGNSTVFLHAQISAQDFYHKFQFVSEGEIFMDAGIAHVKMSKQIK